MSGLPVAAYAQDANAAAVAEITAGTANTKAQANYLNDLARCQIVAAGGVVPGDLGPCPPPMPQAMAPTRLAPAPVATSTVTGTCVAATRALTKAELDIVNDYEIALNRAVANKTPLPSSTDVAPLIGCL